MIRGEFIIRAPWMVGRRVPLSALEDVIRDFFSIECSAARKRELRVLALRTGLGSERVWTLEEVGTVVGVSKQRVQQVEKVALAALGEFLRTGMHVKRRVAADAALRGRLEELAEALSPHAFPMTEGSAAERVSRVFEGASIGSPVLRIVLWGLGFEESRPSQRASQPSNLWVAGGGEERRIIAVSNAIRDTLVRCVLPLTFDDLRLKVAGVLATGPCPPDGVLRKALELCHDVEQVGQSLQASFASLRNVKDRAYRVLYETGKTMAARDIAREIDRRVSAAGGPRQTTRVLVTNGLASDARFKHVGRSAWALAEWDVDTRTIAELMVAALRKAGGALTAEEIWESAKARRPGLRWGPLRSSLSKDRFVLNTEGRYELAEWLTSRQRERYRAARCNRPGGGQEIARETARMLRERTPPELPLTELARELQRQLCIGVSVGAICTRVERLPSVEVRREAHGGRIRRIAVAVSDGSTSALPREHRTSRLEAIQSAVRQILSHRADGTSPLRELRDEVLRQLRCPPSSFYEAVRRMPDIRKRPREHASPVMCYLEHRGAHLGSLAAAIRQADIRAEAQRALTLLRVDTVDLALFQFGRLFESTLRRYMLGARETGRFAVSEQDLTRLSRMVDWLSTAELISDRSALDFLRIKRNERAHDDMPGLEERQALLASSSQTAEVYVRYIALLARLLESVETAK